MLTVIGAQLFSIPQVTSQEFLFPFYDLSKRKWHVSFNVLDRNVLFELLPSSSAITSLAECSPLKMGSFRYDSGLTIRGWERTSPWGSKYTAPLPGLTLFSLSLSLTNINILIHTHTLIYTRTNIDTVQFYCSIYCTVHTLFECGCKRQIALVISITRASVTVSYKFSSCRAVKIIGEKCTHN